MGPSFLRELIFFSNATVYWFKDPTGRCEGFPYQVQIYHGLELFLQPQLKFKTHLLSYETENC